MKEFNSLNKVVIYSRSWARLEEPPIVQPLKNFPTLYETPRFNTVFTRALHWSLIWAMPIQLTPSYPIPLRSILILPTQPHLTREWSDPTYRNLPWFFFHCKSTHNKIHCQNSSC
jgi:hypothetical protein